MRAMRVWETAAIFLAIAVATATAGVRVTQFTFSSGVDTGSTSSLVAEGSEVKFRCRVEYVNITRTPTVTLRKRFPFALNYTVSTNEVIDDAFVDNGIAISPIDTQPNGVDVYEWIIAQARVGHSGIYVCIAGTNTSMSISLNVTVEPTNIDLYINDELQPKSDPTMPYKKTLSIGQTYRLRCVASGANPFPNVTVQNASTVFIPTVSPATYTVRENSTLPQTINRTTAVTVQFTMDRVNIGRPIVCSAGVRKANATSYTFIPVADNVVPQFQCQDKMTYDPNQNTFVMSCQVYGSNLTLSVAWHDSNYKNITIKGVTGVDIRSADDNRYSLLVRPPTGSDIWWTMTLTVNNPKSVNDLTTNDYHFVAVNSMGQTIHTVDVLAPGAGGNKPTSAAASPFMSSVGFLAALFCAVAAAFGRI